MKKYEFTGETTNYYGKTLHRIRRISDGFVGGWIESEDNLSHEGTCFVYDNAKVYDNAVVSGNAWVCGNALVYEKAQVYGNAKVYGNTQVYENAQVYDNAVVSGNAWVCGSARVYGNAQVYGLAIIFGDAVMDVNARVFGSAQVRKSPLSTNAHKYPITMTETYIFIGCEGRTKEYWKANINEIAKKHGYSKKELKALKLLLNALLAQQRL